MEELSNGASIKVRGTSWQRSLSVLCLIGWPYFFLIDPICSAMTSSDFRLDKLMLVNFGAHVERYPTELVFVRTIGAQ
jgi:hypothetical protein